MYPTPHQTPHHPLQQPTQTNSASTRNHRCPHHTRKEYQLTIPNCVPPLEQNNHNTHKNPVKPTNTKTSDTHHTKPKRYAPKNQNPQNTRQNPVTNITPTLPTTHTPTTNPPCYPPPLLNPHQCVAVICCYLAASVLLLSMCSWLVLFSVVIAGCLLLSGVVFGCYLLVSIVWFAMWLCLYVFMVVCS